MDADDRIGSTPRVRTHRLEALSEAGEKAERYVRNRERALNYGSPRQGRVRSRRSGR